MTKNLNDRKKTTAKRRLNPKDPSCVKPSVVKLVDIMHQLPPPDEQTLINAHDLDTNQHVNNNNHNDWATVTDRIEKIETALETLRPLALLLNHSDEITEAELNSAATLLDFLATEIQLRIACKRQAIVFNVPDKIPCEKAKRLILQLTNISGCDCKSWRLRKSQPSKCCPLMLEFDNARVVQRLIFSQHLLRLHPLLGDAKISQSRTPLRRELAKSKTMANELPRESKTSSPQDHSHYNPLDLIDFDPPLVASAEGIKPNSCSSKCLSTNAIASNTPSRNAYVPTTFWPAPCMTKVATSSLSTVLELDETSNAADGGPRHDGVSPLKDACLVSHQMNNAQTVAADNIFAPNSQDTASVDLDDAIAAASNHIVLESDAYILPNELDSITSMAPIQIDHEPDALTLPKGVNLNGRVSVSNPTTNTVSNQISTESGAPALPNGVSMTYAPASSSISSMKKSCNSPLIPGKWSNHVRTPGGKRKPYELSNILSGEQTLSTLIPPPGWNGAISNTIGNTIVHQPLDTTEVDTDIYIDETCLTPPTATAVDHSLPPAPTKHDRLTSNDSEHLQCRNPNPRAAVPTTKPIKAVRHGRRPNISSNVNSTLKSSQSLHHFQKTFCSSILGPPPLPFPDKDSHKFRSSTYQSSCIASQKNLSRDTKSNQVRDSPNHDTAYKSKPYWSPGPDATPKNGINVSTHHPFRLLPTTARPPPHRQLSLTQFTYQNTQAVALSVILQLLPFLQPEYKKMPHPLLPS